MSAPERIWVWGWYDVDRDNYPVFEGDWDEDNPIKHAPWLTSAEMPPAEYIRADAVAEMIRQAVDDVTGLHLVIAAIREATVGGKPMLSDLPAALRGWQKTAVLAEREACAELAHDWQNETGTDIAAAARICPQIAHAIRARGKA